MHWIQREYITLQMEGMCGLGQPDYPHEFLIVAGRWECDYMGCTNQGVLHPFHHLNTLCTNP